MLPARIAARRLRLRAAPLGCGLRTRVSEVHMIARGVVSLPNTAESPSNSARTESDPLPEADAAVLSRLMAGSLPSHRLEQELNDAERAAHLRRLYVEATTAAASPSSHPPSLSSLPLTGNSFDSAAFYESVRGTNCENVIGFVPLPVGAVGPMLLDGKDLTVPLATTEGALIASTNRGARATRAAGGIVSALLSDAMTRAPVIECIDMPQAASMKAYVESPATLKLLQTVFSSTSRFGKLLDAKVTLAGRHAYIRFKCATGDAMGMNMVGKGVDAVVGHILSDSTLQLTDPHSQSSQSFPGARLLALSGNLCADKKPTAVNWIEGRGKSVSAEAVLPAQVVKDILKTTPEALVRVNTQKNLVGSALAGAIGGFNAHASNLVTALFLACGQDPAQNVESSNCITTLELHQLANEEPGVRIACTMPSIECGTVGGGTSLAAQRACLELLGMAGASEVEPGANARSLARVVCGTVLCGELSLLSALSSNHLISAHLALNRK